MLLKDRKVLVFGAGKSGISATRLLQKQGAKVVLYDSNSKVTIDSIKEKIAIDQKFELLIGELPDKLIDTIDLLVLSPGIPTDIIEVKKIIARKIPVWGEVELAYHFSQGKIIGITGTNGKTTTTSLVGDIMKAHFAEVFVVGNIGNPYTDYALETTEDSVIVAELSSFQLETIVDFKPDISVILNITQDHLNRHHTMENYIQAKLNITKKQTQDELCILNYDDKILQDVAKDLSTKVMFFSISTALRDGIYLDGEDIIYSSQGETYEICNINELRILGKHNYENVMAAVGIAIAMGVPLDCISKAVKEFRAVEHRIEYVETINGVTYYNDSKGTNPDASIKAVEAMKSPTILIGGGYDKQIEFDEWIESFQNKIKCLILLGDTREKIAQTAKRHGFTNIIMVDSLKEAVRVSALKAEAGDAVLLSPACASFDMFESYEERGRLFKEYVREMISIKSL